LNYLKRFEKSGNEKLDKLKKLKKGKYNKFINFKKIFSEDEDENVYLNHEDNLFFISQFF